jgi:hypothetical protein
MASPEHESIIGSLTFFLSLQIANMGLFAELDLLGTTKVRYRNFHKRPDACIGPVGSTPVILNFVIEVGVSESSPRLAINAEKWLLLPGSAVQIAVTVEASRTRPEIVICCWECVSTRSNTQSAVCTQRVTISYTNNTTAVTEPITLPFQKVVGRPIDPSRPQEQNFVLTANDLAVVAEKVWRRQNFIS